MGFLDHTTNNIIVDAVLTDKGREKLAQSGTGGGLNIVKYAFADNEVDYTLLKKYGEMTRDFKIFLLPYIMNLNFKINIHPLKFLIKPEV